jgi:hypothetical protein
MPDRKTKLPYALESFNEAVRWRHASAALQWVDPAVSAQISDRFRAVFAEVEIADVEMLDVRMGADGKTAECLVKFSWYDQRDLTVRSGVELQGWTDTGKGWVLTYQNPPSDPKAQRSPFVTLDRR